MYIRKLAALLMHIRRFEKHMRVLMYLDLQRIIRLRSGRICIKMLPKISGHSPTITARGDIFGAKETLVNVRDQFEALATDEEQGDA